MLPIDLSLRIEDDHSVGSHEGPEDEEDPAVQILGLEMIEDNFQIIGLDVLEFELALQTEDDYPLYDVDMSSDSRSFANDSLDLGNCRRHRMNRRGSNVSNDSYDSYANDSLDIARNTISKRSSNEEKDTVPIGMIEIVDLTPDRTPIVVKSCMLNVKNTVAPVATPDLATIRPKRISNSAA
jgi:hypothetical protein